MSSAEKGSPVKPGRRPANRHGRRAGWRRETGHPRHDRADDAYFAKKGARWRRHGMDRRVKRDDDTQEAAAPNDSDLRDGSLSATQAPPKSAAVRFADLAARE